MKHKKLYTLFALTFMATSLSGCSGVRDRLGLDKESPDEFSVITRAPLEIPPTLNAALPTPNLGTPRPQEQTTINQAQEAVFGNAQTATNNISTGENTLLNKANATNTDPNIRAQVNKDTQELADRNEAVADKILNLSGKNKTPSATVVDAKQELERIQQKLKDSEIVTGDDTPYIEE